MGRNSNFIDNYVIDEEDLLHYGTPRKSGRYPWGSGQSPYQSGRDFLGYVNALKKQGLSEKEIATGLGMSLQQLRAQRSLARETQRRADVALAIKLKESGMSNVAIGQQMGINESSVRNLLDPSRQEKAEITQNVSNSLKEEVSKTGFLDVGLGTEAHMGVSGTKLNNSLAQLQEEGYEVYKIRVQQAGTGQFTTLKVLCPPGTEYKEVYQNLDKIGTVAQWSDDGGRTMLGLKTPLSIDQDRLRVVYKEDGGADKDGVIELRRGVDDLSMGGANYAQVRIMVDGTHFLKGMAIYNDNMPDGVDLMFNTNKSATGNKLDALKSLKDDDDNPFGSYIRRQIIDEDGNVTSAVNIVNEEGAWNDWSRTLSSQVLSKQPIKLAEQQLGIALKSRQEEYDEIMALTNPVVKRELLTRFAAACESEAVDLKAAALPRQASKVILPVTDLPENKVYAPTFRNGETVVLIRYPHGGTFEIPELIVDNRNRSARSIIGNALDAIGINPSVAQKLSGADFDGDTVIVIPNNNRQITSSASLKALQNFDPRESYAINRDDGATHPARMTEKAKQQQMGSVSNLITDMTIKGASMDEIARAVRHSMVVIDAAKHDLDYRQSAVDNGIAELKTTYQGGANRGASTLVSRSSAQTRPESRREMVDPATGRRYYLYDGDVYTTASGQTRVFNANSYTDRNGNRIIRTTTSTQMYDTDDPYKLSSGTDMENVYAAHATNMRQLANDARANAAQTIAPRVNQSARNVYSEEVASINAKIRQSDSNRPLERQAQLLQQTLVEQKRLANPNMEPDEIQKIRNMALREARARTGANKTDITLTDKEWEAIQANAVSANTLTKVIQNSDLDSIKQRATPRTTVTLSSNKRAQAQALLNAGLTQAEVADHLGISTSTVAAIIQGTA